MIVMKRSRLCSKIQICEYLESASEKQTLEVIEWIKQELECNNMNELLIKVFMKSKELFTNDALINISNKTNVNNINKKESISIANNKHSKTNNNDRIILPLLKLPNDLINNIALFLNEKDLMYFERCNRMLYKMINNAAFLQKCRNFKKFLLTDDKLDQIVSQRSDCYQYSFAHELEFDVYDWKDKFKSMMFYGSDSYKYNSNWLTSLFKSIVKLDFGSKGMPEMLLDLMHVELLFDKHDSNLSQVTVSNFLDESVSFKSFRRKYLKYFNQESKHLRQIKILDMMTVYGTTPGSFTSVSASSNEIDKYSMFHMIHLKLVDFVVDCKSFTNFSPYLKRLTLSWCDLSSNDSISNDNHNSNNNKKKKNDVNIDTLRLISIHNEALQDILFKESFINEMNFESNLKNLTIKIQTPDKNMGYLSSILKKEHLFNLENVNVLFLTHMSNQLWINYFFDILIQNIRHLKHQFKQLHFGIRKYEWNEASQRYLNGYSFFSLNSTVDTTFINKQKKQWNSLQYDKKYTDCSKEKTMFDLSEAQWV